MLNEKEIDYECKLEGDIYQKLRARLDSDVNASIIKFEVGDACNLREDLGQFNLVLASNLICRLTEPQLFLSRLKTLVKKNGYVILSTPFTWGEQFTPKVFSLYVHFISRVNNYKCVKLFRKIGLAVIITLREKK